MEEKLFIRVDRELKREAQAELIRRGMSLQRALGPKIEVLLQGILDTARAEKAEAESA
mgnify:CR=1 FL=1